MIPDRIETIKVEIERRRLLLIKSSYSKSSYFDPIERERIQSILERSETPSRPSDPLSFTKQFCVSAFSYAPLRKYLTSFIGNIPMRNTIQIALSKALECNDLLMDENWTPESIYQLALSIQKIKRYNLTSKQFNPRIISVLITGSEVLANELKNGLDSFYHKLSNKTKPNEMWEYAQDFSKPINNVGVALICDFFKEMGYTRYVKVDHHFRREFPEIISDGSVICRKSSKENFILSQEISDAIGITPFHLDSILYLWGRYCKIVDSVR